MSYCRLTVPVVAVTFCLSDWQMTSLIKEMSQTYLRRLGGRYRFARALMCCEFIFEHP